MAKLLYLAAGATFFPLVSAWGALGHEVVAYVAQDFVSSATESYIQNILGSTTASYMASVATWADTYRYTTAGSWSAPLHFIDANDNPPSSCSVNYARDCDGGACVVSAITNYTSQLRASGTSSAEMLNAMRFVIHFVGDIHQPLHDEALDRGGNSIDVTYDGDDTNLHSIWDTAILEQLAGGSTISTARSYATSLTQTIRSGSTWTATSWTSGLALNQATVLSWASQANAYVCSDVMPSGISAVESGDLSRTYYTDHNHVVRIQLARAGYRLAAWLNFIATGSTQGL